MANLIGPLLPPEGSIVRVTQENNDHSYRLGQIGVVVDLDPNDAEGPSILVEATDPPTEQYDGYAQWLVQDEYEVVVWGKE